jgi:hypothetical protein
MSFEIGPLMSLPASPPVEVLQAIGAAAAADELRAENRELHFRKDQLSGA